MKVLELFAGSRSFSKVSEEMGMETFTSDYKQFYKIDYVVDIMDFDINKLPFQPDIIWASPPCTTFSIASCSTHWTPDKKPKTEKMPTGALKDFEGGAEAGAMIAGAAGKGDSPMKQGVKRPYPPNATDKRKEAQDKREKEKTKELIERKKRWEPNPSERWDPTPRPKTKRIPQDSPMKQGYSDPDSGIKGKYETFRQWRDHIADSINVGARKGDQYKKRMKREAEKKQRMADAKDIKAKAPGIGGRKV